MTNQQFDSWLMNGSGSSASPEAQMESALNLQIDQLDTICEFTDDQRLKLELAGARDVSRLIRQADELRSELVGKSFPQDDITELWERIQPLSEQFQRGGFGDGSLFQKVLAGIMDDDQAATYEQMLTERWNRSFEAAVKVAIASIEQSVPMTNAQRDALVEVIVPPPRPETGNLQYTRYLVLYQLSTVPPAELAAVFDEAQLKALQQFQDQGRQMKQTLQSLGLLE